MYYIKLSKEFTVVINSVSTYIQDLEADRQIELEEVLEYCHSIGCPVVETSAKVL